METVRHVRRIALAALLGITFSLAALLGPSPVARAAENSWRYDEGRLITPFDTVIGEDGVRPLAGFSTWFWNGTGWETTYMGNRMTVDDSQGFGVDVSHYNGTIDWAAAKRAGVCFAIIRCGTNVNDGRNDDYEFVNNVRGCQANGIPFGVYLYSYADNVAEAHSEADHVFRRLNDAGLTPDDLVYPIYYDLEESRFEYYGYRPLLASMADAFCTRMEQAGYTAGVYANRNWWQNFLTDPVFNRWERWIADWGVTGPSAHVAYGEAHTLWQCMATGWVDGIGQCDIDFDYRDRTAVPDGDVYQGAMYRLYNRSSGEHLFTGSVDEANLVCRRGWVYEGVAWRSPDSGTPVYRLYNPSNGEHFYTSDEAEYEELGNIGWNREGVSFYSDEGKGRPIFRLFLPGAVQGTHHFTTSLEEFWDLPYAGWVQEGVAFYALP